MITAMLKNKNQAVLCCLFCLAPYVFTGNHALAEEARLKNIVIHQTSDYLLCTLSVEGAFREKTRKAVLSGVPVSFSIYININRVRNLWLDKKIQSLKLTHTIRYNQIRKEFHVTRSWEKGITHTVGSFSDAQELMCRIDQLNIIALTSLDKGKTYQVSAMAELSKITLPLYLHYILFFLTLWDFETDWYTIRFTY